MTNPFDEGPEIYHGYSVDDEDQPQGYGDSLSDERGLREPLDEGYSPPGRWSSGQRFGNTAYEEAIGETLAQRLAQEEPDTDPYGWPASEGEGRQVGGVRAGHLKAYDLGPQEPIVERAEQSEWAGSGASLAGEEPYWDRQVGGPRAGRLLSSDEGVGEDVEKDVVAFDVGIDGAGASAEEAAMHVIEDDSWSSDR